MGRTATISADSTLPVKSRPPTYQRHIARTRDERRGTSTTAGLLPQRHIARTRDERPARHQEARQAAADEAKQIAMQTAALDESARIAASASVPQPSVSPGPLQTLLLPATLNDKFRSMIQRTGKGCNAITDHVWVTTEHISVMCDRRLRAAFIHEGAIGDLGVPANDRGLLPLPQPHARRIAVLCDELESSRRRRQ
jgi:hypothetical protein